MFIVLYMLYMLYIYTYSQVERALKTVPVVAQTTTGENGG